MFDSKALVTQANKLIMSNQKTSVEGKRFMVALCSKVSPNDEDFKSYRISFDEYSSFTGINPKDVISSLPKITKQLMSQVLEYYTEDNLYQWAVLCKAQHRRKLGDVIVQFHPDLKPMYLGLKEHFTEYKLENVLHMRGKHSIRLYEIIKSQQFKAQGYFDVAWNNILNVILETEPEFKKMPKIQQILGTDYKKFPDFEKYVLKPAQSEMKKHSDICFEYKKIKRSRFVCGVRFYIKENVPTENHNQMSFFDIVANNNPFSDEEYSLPAEEFKKIQIERATKAIDNIDRGNLCREFQKAVKREYGHDFPLGLLEGVSNQKIAAVLPCVGSLDIKQRSNESSVIKYIKKVLKSSDKVME